MRKTAIIAFIAPMLVAAALLGGALLSAGTASAQTTTTDYDNNNNGLIDVRTLAQLNAIRYDLDGNGDATHADYIAAFPNRDTSASGRMGCRQGNCTGYELRANLDFDTDGDGSTYTSGAGWTPLGGHTNSATAFSATFEGNDYTVSNLYINLSTTGDSEGNYVGLFGDLAATSTIRNVGLVDPNVANARGGAGFSRTGVLAGRNNGGTVSGSYVSGGSVTGNQGTVAAVAYPMTGCLLGYSQGTVSDSYATCAATATGADDAFDRAGGLVGWNAGTVRDSYATGTVAGDLQAGGLVGLSSGSAALVTDSYATGAVSASAAGGYAGGLVGFSNAGADVTGSYATGAVSASGSSSYVGGLAGNVSSAGTQVRASYAIGAVSTSGDNGNAGGLVGELEDSSDIVASYASGAVSASGGGANRLGGLVARISGAGSSVTNSYWDTQTSGQTASAAGVGKTTSELQSPTGYTGIYAGWNLNLDGQTGDDDPWYFGAANQYPVLRYGDHDWDDDGLIEVNRLPQLDAVRWDLNGDGAVDTGTSVADTAKYRTAFGGALAGMGCLRDHDDNTATPKVAGCIGYELTQDLDFDTNGSGATYTTSSAGVVTGDAGDDYHNGGKGWKPIGNWTNQFTATFAGNGKTIANLFIKDTAASRVGLFGYVGTDGRVERLGVRDVNVTGRNGGGLVGGNGGTISNSYATGSVTTSSPTASNYNDYVGGLVGENSGTISASYATSSVTTTSDYLYVGGLAGYNGGTISSSYATGSATGSVGKVGGLVGSNWGTIRSSYATGSVTGSSGSGKGHIGGLVGQNENGSITASYATGSVTVDNSASAGGLVGQNDGGTIKDSYATGSVTVGSRVTSSVIGSGQGGEVVGAFPRSTVTAIYRNIASYATGSATVNGQTAGTYVGGLAGYNSGTISASYATGSVTGYAEWVGGLVGQNSGTISTSYANGSVTGGIIVGGLVGLNQPGTILVGVNQPGTIIASYSTGSVTGSTAGGLTGSNSAGGTISTSYATGAVAGGAAGGGLVGSDTSYRSKVKGTATNSYWDTETTGQSTSAGGTGKTTSELQLPTGYSGIYATWNLNLDGIAGNDDPWDFGADSQYPVLKYGGLVLLQQRSVSVSVQSVNRNIPIVGGPVTATIDGAGITGITWQWQNSADGSAWTDIANATGATYIPVTADAANGGKHLRVKASFTAEGARQTLTTGGTVKVVSDVNAPVIAATSAPVVGEKLHYYLSATGATHRTAWQWRRCDNAAMTTNCVQRAQSNSTSDAHTEYTPVAGTDSDVGKYLQAHAYYADSANGGTWTRTETPVLGPVVAAPAAAPSASP